jgi:PAS domain S-box-containing protein
LVEDNPADVHLFRRTLSQIKNTRSLFSLTHAAQLADALTHLHQSQFDIIFSDLNLPDSDGTQTFTQLLAQAPQIPIVILTGQSDDALAIQAVQLGAQDYIVKNDVNAPTLNRTIRYAIERHRVAAAFRRQNDYLTMLHEVALELLRQPDVPSLLRAIVNWASRLLNAPLGFISIVEGNQLVIKAQADGVPPSPDLPVERGEGLAGKVWENMAPLVIPDYPTWSGRLGDDWLNALRAAAGVPIRSGDVCLGAITVARFADNPLPFNPDEVELLSNIGTLASLALHNARLYEQAQSEIAIRKVAEAALAQERDLLHTLMDNIPDTIYFKDRFSRYTRINRAQARFLGLTDPTEAVGKTDADFQPPELSGKFFFEEQDLLQTGQPLIDRMEYYPTQSGEPRWLSATKVPIVDPDGHILGLVGISRDVTERRRAERRLQAQYGVTRILSEAADLKQAAPRILHVISQSLELDMGELWLVDREAKRLSLVDLWRTVDLDLGEFEEFTRERTFVKGDGFSGRVWASRAPLWMADVMNHPGFPPLAIADRAGLHGGMGFPIQINDDIIGVMTFFSRAIRPPDADLLEMFGAIGSQIGQFVERRRAEDALRTSEANLNYLIHRFVPSAVADQLTSGSHNVTLGGERRVVSVLFADIRGYTSLTETLDPPTLMDVLNTYYGIIGRVILKHGGTINQYAGDMIMASFNAPNPQLDHAARAVQAALESQIELQAARLNQTTLVNVHFGMGVNTGPAVVGFVGFEARFDYATLGETTNIAFRFSSMAEGGQVLIGPETLAEVKDRVDVRPLGPLTLKNRAAPLPVFVVERWR